jgi:phage host-nuclease inhibitor protein Gam
MKITGWDDVDKVLLEIAELERRIAERKAEAERIVETTKAAAAAALEPLTRMHKDLLTYLEAFVREHESEMTGRSRALVHGRVWLRRVTVLTARSWQRALDWLLDNKRMDYVRVKYEVNKEALESAPERTLQACGVRWKTKDAFGYELGEALPK